MSEVKPKKYGFAGKNIVCADCGKYFSEQEGHKCEDESGGYY